MLMEEEEEEEEEESIFTSHKDPCFSELRHEARYRAALVIR